jgi:hypothetical protein
VTGGPDRDERIGMDAYEQPICLQHKATGVCVTDAFNRLLGFRGTVVKKVVFQPYPNHPERTTALAPTALPLRTHQYCEL